MLSRSSRPGSACQGRWLLLLLSSPGDRPHHAGDACSRRSAQSCSGLADELPPPLPFRNFVAQARLGVARQEHEAFFREHARRRRRADRAVRPDRRAGRRLRASSRRSARSTRRWRARLRAAARAALGRERGQPLPPGLGAGAGAHRGRDDVVFGTVLFGRMQGGEGADRALGLFINTLPMRVRLGEQSVSAERAATSTRCWPSCCATSMRSLALAQRCSGVAAPAPLFSALLNYRHSASAVAAPTRGRARRLAAASRCSSGEERTNYPLTLSVDDLGEGFALTAQVTSRSIDPERVCAFMQPALEQLVERARARSEPRPCATSTCCPPPSGATARRVERHRAPYPRGALRAPAVRGAGRAHAPRPSPSCTSERALTYAELNGRANRLARPPARRSASARRARRACAWSAASSWWSPCSRSCKAGGAYVPLDPPTRPSARPSCSQRQRGRRSSSAMPRRPRCADGVPRIDAG